MARKHVARRMLVLLLLIFPIFMTGCDASKIIEAISKVAQGIQQAIPAVKEVVNAISGNSTNTNTNTTTNTAANTDTESSASDDANVIVINPEDEEVTDPTKSTGDASSLQKIDPKEVDASVEHSIKVGKEVDSYDESGVESTIAEAAELKSRYGVTILDGKEWKTDYEVATPGEWTGVKAGILLDTLAKLPPGFRSNAKAFSLQNSLKDAEEGYEFDGLGGEPIILSAGASDFDGLIVHEMTHRFQGQNPDVLRLWAKTFWPEGKLKSPSASDYGNSKPSEDMADSVAEFFNDPENLQKTNPERYEFIKQHIWK